LSIIPFPFLLVFGIFIEIGFLAKYSSRFVELQTLSKEDFNFYRKEEDPVYIEL
jgi:hypothetical protein